MTPYINVPFRKKLLSRQKQHSAYSLRGVLTTLCICLSVFLILLNLSLTATSASAKELEAGMALRQARMAGRRQPHSLPAAVRHQEFPELQAESRRPAAKEPPAHLPAFLREEGVEVPAARIEGDAGQYYPSFWPVSFSEVGYISCYYGLRTDPIDGEGTEWHMGLDLADRYETEIYAAASGTVVEVRSTSGYGETLVVDHGNGLQTRYSHCSSILVSEGDSVQQGQCIALMGNTGRSTGTHLDFRVYVDGYAVDPLNYLED